MVRIYDCLSAARGMITDRAAEPLSQPVPPPFRCSAAMAGERLSGGRSKRHSTVLVRACSLIALRTKFPP